MKTVKRWLTAIGIQILALILYAIILGLLLKVGVLDKDNGPMEAAKGAYTLAFFFLWANLAIIFSEHEVSKKRTTMIEMFFIALLLGYALPLVASILLSAFPLSDVNAMLVMSGISIIVTYILMPILIWKLTKHLLTKKTSLIKSLIRKN